MRGKARDLSREGLGQAGVAVPPGRRRFLAGLLGLTLLPWSLTARAAVAVKAVRVWPARDYSRLTLELSEAVPYKHFVLNGPPRLVLDLEGLEPVAPLTDLGNLVTPQDPYVASVRVARNRPGVTRVVAELKTEIKPQVFNLKPMGNYGHRLVVDLYPVNAAAIAEEVEDAIERAGKGLERSDGQTAASGDKPTKPAYDRLVTIAIDPGHGGEDPGAIGANGTREKDVTLAIARRLKAHIDRQDGLHAVLIRDDDYFIPLHERVKKARRVKADLFVSIHADAFLKPTARGSSVFALSEKGATSTAARWLAKKENDADLVGGVNFDVKDVYLKKTLLDLSLSGTIDHSLKLGRAVLEQLGEINDLHKAEVEQAGFAVLKAPDIPSILVETAFISNPEEEKRLVDEGYQEKMARAIVSGISRYFEKNPPMSRARLARGS